MALSGYAGRILRVDLSSGSTTVVSTTGYADFLGGRGIAAKIYWDEVPPEVKASDPENRLIFAIGPLAGLPVLGASRWTVCGKSAMTAPQHFCYGNLGGQWGAGLKFAGYDAIVVVGRSEKPVYLSVGSDTAELRDASQLWGKGSIETRDMLKSEMGSSARVVAIGPAGERMVAMASLLADNDASGSGGLGATMGSKNLKAVVVRGSQKRVRVAQPGRLQDLTQYYRGLRRIPLFASPNRCTINDDPLLNLRTIPAAKMKRDPCYGCLGRCPRRLYEAQDGKSGKFVCHSAMFYQPLAEEYYGDWNDVPFYANKLCNDYGLDAVTIDLMIGWLRGCCEAGILTEKNTGLPLSKMGSLEFVETLVRKISLRDGLGDILAQGIDKAAALLGPDAEEQAEIAGFLSKPRYNVLYGPRLYIVTGLLYAMEPRTPIQQLHEISNLMNKWLCWAKNSGGSGVSSDAVRAIARRFFGSEMAVDFSTYEGKALAAKMIQDREYAKECLILCDWLFPVMDLESSENHVGDPTLESSILSAVVGQEMDEEGLCRVGEKVFNLQRAILVREGHRGRDFDELRDYCYSTPLEWNYFNHDCLLPGKEGQIISRKGEVVDRHKFERMKDEYYHLRNWDVSTGLQTRTTLEDLGLVDIADDLEKRGLIAETRK